MDKNMKITKSMVERYYFKENWSYADIYISDDGSLLIRSDYGDYTYKWNSFGNDFKSFLINIGTNYLINKLGGSNAYVFDYNSTIKAIKDEIILSRKGISEISTYEAEAREIWNEINYLDLTYDKDIFYLNIINTKFYRLLCNNDPTYIPCRNIINPQLNSFINEIWSYFIEELKKEKGL